MTGTLTFLPTLNVTVSPAQANINQNFTFTIVVGNNGTAPTTGNIVFDSFDSYLSVISVASSPRGAVTKLTNQFTVNIGTVMPHETITITAVVRVNNTLTQTMTKSNLVTLYYDPSKSITDSVTYKAVFSTLPPTGELPLDWREALIKPLPLALGTLIMLAGAVLITIGIRAKLHGRKE